MKNKLNFAGFSLIELMVVVAIIGILSAIAIPTYSTYVRSSRTSEAQANINAIAQYEEQYYSENNRYTTAAANPSQIPNPIDNAGTGGTLPFNSSHSDWTELGAIFTNNTQLRFQYRAFAGQFNSSGGSVTTGNFVSYTSTLFSTATSTSYTCTAASLGNSPTAQSYGITQTAYANWFVITAMGNQVADTTCSIFVKVNDRPAVYSLNANF